MNWSMDEATRLAGAPTAQGSHFSCSLSAVLIARVHAFGGDEAVAELLRSAGVQRSVEYLTDITNWISYDEAIALWAMGTRVTRHPRFARAVGEDAARRLIGSPVAALLRSLGSPEAVYRQMATTARKFSLPTQYPSLSTATGSGRTCGIRASAAAPRPASR